MMVPRGRASLDIAFARGRGVPGGLSPSSSTASSASSYGSLSGGGENGADQMAIASSLVGTETEPLLGPSARNAGEGWIYIAI
jgi:hypothetical protein